MNRYLKSVITSGLVTGALSLAGAVALAQPVRPGGGGGSPTPGPMDPLGKGGAGQLPGGAGQPMPGTGGARPGTIPQTKPGDQRPALPHQGPGVPPRPGPLDKGADKGTTPATPHPGEGRPATPAIPGNERARENTQDTPSRNRGDARVQLPGNVTSTSMVSGLTQVNIDKLNINSIQNNIININGAMSASQVQATITAVQNNTQAASIAQQLTAKLIDQGILKTGQQVVGFQDGKVFVTGGTTAGAGAGAGLGTGTQPMGGAGATVGGGTTAGTQTNLSRDAMLNGLVNLNLQNLNVQASNLVNVNTSLKEAQVTELIQALNVNSEAKAIADKLTQQLLNDGLLKEGQQVVGVAGEKIFITAATK